MNKLINYSQCWEDTDILKSALNINKDDVVLSVTSGGDNSIALFLKQPKEIVLIDKNPVQNYITELKLKAPSNLSYEEYLELLGVNKSSQREILFTKTKPNLSQEAFLLFRKNLKIIKKGVIHAGKFEFFLNMFRKYLLPFVHSKNEIDTFLDKTDVESQVNYYETSWNTWRWKLFFKLASNPKVLKKYARQTVTNSYKEVNKDYDYKKRLEKVIYQSPLKENHYIHYCLKGSYGDNLPEYLTYDGYLKLQKVGLDKINFVSSNILDYLQSIPSNTFTKFNLSDIFDSLSEKENKLIWEEIVRVAKKNAKVVHWCNQIERIPPKSLKNIVIPCILEEERLWKQDKVFFYRSFHINTILK